MREIRNDELAFFPITLGVILCGVGIWLVIRPGSFVSGHDWLGALGALLILYGILQFWGVLQEQVMKNLRIKGKKVVREEQC